MFYWRIYASLSLNMFICIFLSFFEAENVIVKYFFMEDNDLIIPHSQTCEVMQGAKASASTVLT